MLFKQIFKYILIGIFSIGIVPLSGEGLTSLDHSIVSIYAAEIDTGKILSEKNSHLSLVPASCMKLFTTGAALHILGAESRFETTLEYDGYIDKTKTLRGNLYIRGGGDPCLGSERIPGVLPWKKQIADWAGAIQNLGIKRIEGKIIGDSSRWEKALAVPSWEWEDLGNYYGAGACALSFHENFYTLFFKPGQQVGDITTILRTDPPTPLFLTNEVTTGPEGSGDQACIYGSEFSPIQFVRGTIPSAVNEFSIKGAIPDPAKCCVELLKSYLRESGIPIVEKDLPRKKDRVPFHKLYSPPMAEIIHWTNQKSIDLYAEHLLKKIGEEVFNEGSTLSGVKAVSDFWKSKKIDLDGFNMVDGSGLSRRNLVTTKQLVEMLLVMEKSPLFSQFIESLPQKGEIRAKPGTMSLVKGYAGYSGNVAFAILINHCANQKLMNKKIEELLKNLKSSPENEKNLSP